MSVSIASTAKPACHQFSEIEISGLQEYHARCDTSLEYSSSETCHRSDEKTRHLSSLWCEFYLSSKEGTKTTLPDFSYAGYKFGESPLPVEYEAPIYFVDNYGAKADDSISDKEAIQKAIRAAEKSGLGGIIQFSSGRYLINENEDNNGPLVITSSSVVLRGESNFNSPRKTELVFKEPLMPKNPDKLNSSPWIIQFVGELKKPNYKYQVIKNQTAGEKKLVLNDIEKINVGSWIVLSSKSSREDLKKQELDGIELNTLWTQFAAEVKHRSYHKVKYIEGNVVHIHSQLPADLDKRDNWHVQPFFNISNVGVENLAIVGNWVDKFVHHESWQGNSGWSALLFKNVTDSWIRNTHFFNVSRGIALSSSANVSVVHSNFDGNPGHNSITVFNSTRCLVSDVKDQSGYFHGPGVAGLSSENVFLRVIYPKNTSYEAHGGQPRSTLFDNVKGGFFYGRWGGAEYEQPNHLRGLVFWNFENTGKVINKFEFVRSTSRFGKIIKPIIVGFYGNIHSFDMSQVGFSESMGKRVYPSSLYCAQKIRRLGGDVNCGAANERTN